MNGNRKYYVAVALLAVLAVIFAFAGTAAPMSEMATTQQESSSNSVTHFQNPPTFDSDWVDITDKCGQYFNITHDLNTMNVTVDITGKTTIDGGVHQRHLGGTGYTSGWSKNYGGAGAESRASSIVETSDGGYALAGYTYRNSTNKDDFYLVKTDHAGNKEWERTYGGTNYDWAYSVVETGDGGYAIAGYTISYGAGGDDFYLVKTDSSGNMLWNKTYGGANDDYCYSLVQTSDGGYALAGGGFANLVKTDSNGNQLWNKTYGYTAKSVVQTSDGGYAIAGGFSLVKTDSNGNQLWNKTYGFIVNSMVQTSDGGYALAGHIGVGIDDTQVCLVKTYVDGTMDWNKTYGDGGWDIGYSVVETSDGGYAVAGQFHSGASWFDFWLVKTDSSGNVQWSQKYGGRGGDEAYSMVKTSDGGYALAGYTDSFDYTVSFWLVKTGVESGLAWTDSTANTVTLYRGATDANWNYVRVRIWTIEEPTWQFGDINQDGVVDAQDLFILSQNYGKAFSLLSLSGIAFIAGVRTYKRRKELKAPER